MPKAIQLIETRNGCAILEKKPRYDVLLHGKKVGQLYFNLRGYVGTLPTPRGTQLYIGERGINAYRKAVAQLNKEWAEANRSCCDSVVHPLTPPDQPFNSTKTTNASDERRDADVSDASS